jgi:hypothetical protein
LLRKLLTLAALALVFSIANSTTAQAKPHNDVSAWLCIHHYEGAWNARTGNGYYGGLQMDMGFQSTYGPEYLYHGGHTVTADKWPSWIQIKVARRARDGWYNPHNHTSYKARGYYPWPNTARACGLI